MVIVPSIDVRGGRVAFRGDAGADVAPRELARRFAEAGADELHLVDLDGAERGDYANFALLAAIAREAGVPCRLAGGIATLDRAAAAADAGFAGVLFSSAVFGDDALLSGIAALGLRGIVEIEARDGKLAPRGGGAALASRAAGRDGVDCAVAAAAAGIRALYVIDLGTEGALGGPSLVLLERIRASLGAAGAATVAIHTGGGVRELDDVRALARWGAASAVVGRALLAGRFTLAEAKAAAR